MYLLLVENLLCFRLHSSHKHLPLLVLSEGSRVSNFYHCDEYLRQLGTNGKVSLWFSSGDFKPRLLEPIASAACGEAILHIE